jgi:hypothetical protein
MILKNLTREEFKVKYTNKMINRYWI